MQNQITEMLAQMGGISSLARELGISESQAADGANALAPAILGGFKKQVQAQPTGLDGLGSLLGQLGGGGLMDQVLSPAPTDVSQGNNILGTIFGSKDVSRTVAQQASAKSGVAPSILKKMLPILAMLISGYMAKRRQTSAAGAEPTGGGLGGLGGLLGGVLGRRQGAGQDAQGGLASMLDMNGDGNALDDILGMAGRMGR